MFRMRMKESARKEEEEEEEAAKRQDHACTCKGIQHKRVEPSTKTEKTSLHILKTSFDVTYAICSVTRVCALIRIKI